MTGASNPPTSNRPPSTFTASPDPSQAGVRRESRIQNSDARSLAPTPGAPVRAVRLPKHRIVPRTKARSSRKPDLILREHFPNAAKAAATFVSTSTSSPLDRMS